MSESSSEICYLVDKLPAELKRIIVSYLGVDDLLNLCITCKSLNEFIGQSHGCMNKFWIKFYTFKMKDLESLASSARNYEKLKVNRVQQADSFKYLTDLQQMWRKVLIYNCEFKRFTFLSDLVESFTETIEELEISDIEILNNEVNICSFKFPNLKRILFRNVPTTAVELFLGMNKKLINASFDISQAVEGKMPLNRVIHRFLMNHQHLKHLQLGPHYIKNLFDHDELNVDFPFKLNKLMLRCSIVPDQSPDLERNICLFLNLQTRIDWILFFELQSDEILSTAWNKIPSLNHVTFIGLEGLFDEPMIMLLEPNENIKTLELISRKILISQLRKFFAAAPQLRILHVQKLTRFIMEFTAKNNQLIQELRYEHIDEDVEEIYENLKKSSENVNQSIELKSLKFWRDESNPFSIDPNFWHS